MAAKQATPKEKEKSCIEIEEDYQVHSRIANSRGMPIVEGYPTIQREVYEIAFEEPDESEYCQGRDYYFDEAGNVTDLPEGIDEGYASRRKKKYPYGYDG